MGLRWMSRGIGFCGISRIQQIRALRVFVEIGMRRRGFLESIEIGFLDFLAFIEE